MRSFRSPLRGLGSPFGFLTGLVDTVTTITSSDGDPASLVDNGDGTFDVIIDAVNVGTITQAQINAGGWITVVEPVVGMSGNNVVLTTTGHVIFVGDVSIESDVEVLGDGSVIGSALPFDATAFPDELLTVRFAYSTGASNFEVTKLARAAAFKRIQFRDSVLDFAQTTARLPTEMRTRQFTMALRFDGRARLNPPRMLDITSTGVYINGRSSGVLVQSRMPNLTGVSTEHTLAPASENLRVISLLAAIDLDGGLPGGETFVVWASIDGAAWVRRFGSTATNAGSSIYTVFFGGIAPASAAGEFDVHNQVWMANQALNPATNWSSFFNADGTIKDLGLDGVIAGVTPTFYLAGNDWLTLNNRGMAPDPVASRTPLTVVNL
jgi:hypothetical protein